MAKPESKQKKNKGKKRKLAVDNDDEDVVASKTLIVDNNEVAHKEENTQKAPKRKTEQPQKLAAKRKKTEGEIKTDLDEDDESEEAEATLHEPTLEELHESERPENVKAIVTVRQKKKQKHQERLLAQKDQNVGKEQKRNGEYLYKWKNAHSDWKYEKLRQISIQQSMFDEQKMDATIWPIALEYLSGTKGAAKDKIYKIAEDAIDQLDKECEPKSAEEQQAIFNSGKYQRARELLQSLC